APAERPPSTDNPVVRSPMKEIGALLIRMSSRPKCSLVSSNHCDDLILVAEVGGPARRPVAATRATVSSRTLGGARRRSRPRRRLLVVHLSVRKRLDQPRK